VLVATVMTGLSACSSTSRATPGTSATKSALSSSPSPANNVTPPAGTTAAPSRNICVSIPPSAVTSAFGGSVTKTEQGNSFVGNGCSYSVTGSNLGVDGQVQVIDLQAYNTAQYEQAKQRGVGAGDVVVTGVGDDAYYAPTTTAAVLRKGDTVYFVAAIFKAGVGVALDTARIKADTVALAKTVAGSI
jgi:hypothetical protein